MSEKVSVKFLFFAKAREIVGQQEIEGILNNKTYTIETLLDEIINLYVVLQPLAKNLLLAVNEEYIAPSQTVSLKDGDIVAILPPLSGG